MFFKIAYKTLLIWATFVKKLLPNTLKICTIWSRCLEFKLCNQQISAPFRIFKWAIPGIFFFIYCRLIKR